MDCTVYQCQSANPFAAPHCSLAPAALCLSTLRDLWVPRLKSSCSINRVCASWSKAGWGFSFTWRQLLEGRRSDFGVQIVQKHSSLPLSFWKPWSFSCLTLGRACLCVNWNAFATQRSYCVVGKSSSLPSWGSEHTSKRSVWPVPCQRQKSRERKKKEEKKGKKKEITREERDTSWVVCSCVHPNMAVLSTITPWRLAPCTLARYSGY